MSTPKPRRRGHRGGEEHEEHEGNLERWLLTYADMITLLMVLFIVLFAISVVDKKKFAALADGLSHQFGATNKVLPAGTGVIDGGQTSNHDQGQLANNPAQPLSPIDQVEISKQRQQQIQKENLLKQEQQTLLNAKQQIEAALQAKGLQNSASFKLTSRGLVVSIVTDQVLFDTGKADLKPVGQQVLDAVAPALLKLPNDISIEGHTDNVPITGGLFASNWELSAVRATTVLRYLMAHDGLQADRMSATGYADTKPVAPNDSAAHQAQNRRVELVVLSTLLTDSTDSTDSTAGANIAGAVIPAGGSG
ncbi:MAG TPA: flagellar motor protein MotB [Acidothermaceae bacterium]